MKQIIFMVVVALTTIPAEAQNDMNYFTGSYEAAKWKTWLLDSTTQIIIAAPPAASQTKSELQIIKAAMAGLDGKKLAQIKYWDAGAPSYRWNQIVLGLVDQKPETQLRMPASWMNLAIYDATILAWQEKIKDKRSRPGESDRSLKPVVDPPLTYSYPCEHTVTAAAAAYVLAYFYPDKKDSIMQLAHAASQSRIDAGVQYPSDATAAWQLGEQVATQIILRAKNDGSATVYKGFVNKDPKRWTGSFAMGITLASYSPIVLHAADQFRLAPPPDFKADMKELNDFKRTNRSNYIALYWANNGPGLWNDLASQKMFEYRMMDDAPLAARIYTLLNVAYHDAAIAIFDSKYTYWGIRPNQYDSAYKSLITTPPFPGYPSGHAAGAATTCAVMEYFFPADAKQFHSMAQECADSRFYAGIHFRTDNEAALKMGATMGKWIVDTWMGK